MNYTALNAERKLSKQKEHTYNGYTIAELKERIRQLNNVHQKLYLSNAAKVIHNLKTGLNLHENESLRNENFNLTKTHLNK
jgi:O-succinylbenzoate synthase